MTFEKHQRDAKKKRNAEEKRALRQKKKERIQSEPESTVETPSIDESTESGQHKCPLTDGDASRCARQRHC